MTNHNSKWKEDDDHYGVVSDAQEVDSDVNEDRNREQMLDRSLDDFLESVEEGIQNSQDMTNVPDDSVFEAAQMQGEGNADE